MQLARCAGFWLASQLFPRGATAMRQLLSLGRSALHCAALQLHCAMQRSITEGPSKRVAVSLGLSGFFSANGTGAVGCGA
ncbi:hypothetical protein QYY77_03925 [Xanthomonas campestris pv. campestris]|uniref:hypothetical protein n=1 Tax=Xanthomonas campestris TaxID=339 RepID=UPI002AD2B46B|nr:hypothetical protein [Xanthomonas campestris]MEA0735234.1 hypothetical protein [Xanthomonas campestris pv. campestris]